MSDYDLRELNGSVRHPATCRCPCYHRGKMDGLGHAMLTMERRRLVIDYWTRIGGLILGGGVLWRLLTL